MVAHRHLVKCLQQVIGIKEILSDGQTICKASSDVKIEQRTYLHRRLMRPLHRQPDVGDCVRIRHKLLQGARYGSTPVRVLGHDRRRRRVVVAPSVSDDARRTTPPCDPIRSTHHGGDYLKTERASKC